MNLKRFWFTILFATVCQASQAEQAFLGERLIKTYWLENSSYLVVTPTQPFDTANGCDVKTSAIISVSEPHFKYVMATVMQSMATGKSIQIYAVDCFTAWGVGTQGSSTLEWVAPFKMQ
ncbi:hypothetical protein [Ideonella paludis]|uniref:hypothetical protein n=1 Tax=Ideonella paludis TaxID=1233411 RepID=UPI0036254C28